MKVLLTKYVSREFVLVVVATVLVFLGKLNGSDWLIISSLYIGARGTQKVLGEKK
jgi:hypothetical protein